MEGDFDILIVAMGFIPMLVSAIRVEKYYTQFWDGFWNIYGLILVCIGLIMGEGDPFSVVILTAVVVCLALFTYYVFAEQRPDLMRSFGSSRVVLPASVVVVLATYTGSLTWALVAGTTLFIVLTTIFLHNRRRRRYIRR